MRIALLFPVVLASSVSVAGAQTLPEDHWQTLSECQNASFAPFYHPLPNRQPLREGEVVWGHPTGGCFEMDLPDRFGGRGWVRIEAGRKLIYSSISGKTLRLEECGNTIYAEAPFAPAVPMTAIIKEDPPVVLPGQIDLNVSFRNALEVAAANGRFLLEERPPHEPDGMPKKSWWRRHWPKVALVSALGAAGVACAVACRQTITQEVNIVYQ